MATYATDPSGGNGQPDAPDTSALLGGEATDSNPTSTAPSATDANRQFVSLVRRIHDDLSTLARMRPAIAPFVRQAQNSLTQGMVKAVAARGAGNEERQPAP